MPERLQIYKCQNCENMVQIIHPSKCEPSCCGKPMLLLKEGVTDAAQEKHVPVIEQTADGYLVKVGSIPHPMQEAHYIEWIEVIADGKCYRQFLNPGDEPEATFVVKADKIMAREFCNLHGLWKA
jgi:superoxide reductase